MELTTTFPAPAALLSTLDRAFPNSRIETRAALASVASVTRIAAGTTFSHQGDASSVGLVLEGHVAARRATADGRHLIVRIVEPGGLAPGLPLAGRPTSVDWIALTPIVGASWRSADVRPLMKADPGFALDLLDQVIGVVEELVTLFDGLVYHDTLRRVARVLHLKADLFFADPPALKRSQLPILVGSSREMTGRVLRLLESHAIIARVGRDGLRLLDPAALAKVVDSGIVPRGGVARNPRARN